MSVERHLGSAWAVLKGPSDPRALLVWVLEHGFSGLLPGPGTRAVDWRAIGLAAAHLPVGFRAVRASGILRTREPTLGLASAREGEQQEARKAVDDAVALARRLGTPLVVVEPGLVPVAGELTAAEDLGDPSLALGDEALAAVMTRRKVASEPALDRACRSLHALSKAHPDIRFCLTVGRNVLSLADLRGLRAVFDDLPAARLGYWHDAALCARREQVLGEPQGEWLQSFCNLMVGMTLSDGGQDGLYLPPGAGRVDYRLLASYVQRSGKPVPAAVELDPAVDSGELPGIRSSLERFGL